ncbi:YlaF family protein [Bacillus sp. 03113]|uniref:YlaF family protein n=1 Tax=Bacillus sp. 03113 TaxID=2578211 RepID=UPI00114278BC|nr:YlaF family protein [Bacillus sp. 03113]
MKQIKWVFLLFALLTTVCIMGIGIAISEKSVLGILFCIFATVFIMGYGFKTKKKMREQGK